MDTPKLNRVDERGLPTYEPHIEKQITATFFNGMEPSPEMQSLMEEWVWTRARAQREISEKRPRIERKQTRLAGWKATSKKRKSSTDETTRGNDKNSPVGTLETGAAKRQGLQGSLSGKRRKG